MSRFFETSISFGQVRRARNSRRTGERGHGVGEGYPDLIPATRAALLASGALYVIENVGGAPLDSPRMLCGSMFGLDVRRHRFFESNFQIPKLKCDHGSQTPRFAPATNRQNLRSTVEVGVYWIPLPVQLRAMGLEGSGLTLPELSQAIPPSYARHIGDAARKLLGS